jgi:hypothetical protein
MVASLAMGSTAFAVLQPPWQGEARTTFQEWDFDANSVTPSPDLGAELRFDLADVWEGIGMSSQSARSHPTRWSASLVCGDGTSLSLQGVDFLLAETTGSGEQSAFLSSFSGGEIAWRKRATVPWESKESETFAHISALSGGVRVASDGWGVGL